MDVPHPFLDFFDKLNWIDGRPLTEVIEPYRAQIFKDVLYTFDDDGRPTFNQVLAGRAKKNWKSADLILAALYRFLAWPSAAGNDCYLLANDEDQAGDDLTLAKKLVEANRIIKDDVEVRAKEIVRTDGKGSLRILPARDVIGTHGLTYLFAGFDEIHGYRKWDLFEAMAPDPSRLDALTWITSYASIFNSRGVPLHDMIERGKAGDDPRAYFSWYSGDHCTDPGFAELEPEARANPSMASWVNPDYLAQQRRRLPSHKFRRLHLNLPGSPDGAFLSPDQVLGCVVPGRSQLQPQAGVGYYGFVDMSGGSGDDATLAIGHSKDGHAVLDLITCQAGSPPFNPRHAVSRFVKILKDYRIGRVVGDAYGGETFKSDFEASGIDYVKCGITKSDLYECLEPVINAGEIELLDHPKMQEQLLTLVHKGSRVDHQSNDHDDHSNALAGVVWLISEPVIQRRQLTVVI